MTELKPCPFRQCGGEGVFSDPAPDGFYRVCCSRYPDCPVYGQLRENKEEAAAYWNDREDGAARFKGGDKVIDRLGQRFTVSSRCVYECHNERGEEFRVLENELEPAPDPLPRDHIDRFWRIGAWLLYRPDGDGMLPERVIVETPGTGITIRPRYVNKADLPQTGWWFHPDGPIQEEVEP